MDTNANLHLTRVRLDQLADSGHELGTPSPFGAADKGNPTIAALPLADTPAADIGVAEITAGSWAVTDRPDAEVLLFLAGDLTVAPEGEAPYDLAAGDLAVLPKGWSGRFTTGRSARFVYLHPART